MSILSPGGESGDAPQTNKYAGLKSNSKARNRREKVKFFDSADWAMRNQNQQGNPDQEAEQGDLPRANFQHIPDQGDADGQGNSVLANENQSAGDSGSSMLTGGADGESPLAGSPLA